MPHPLCRQMSKGKPPRCSTAHLALEERLGDRRYLTVTPPLPQTHTSPPCLTPFHRTSHRILFSISPLPPAPPKSPTHTTHSVSSSSIMLVCVSCTALGTPVVPLENRMAATCWFGFVVRLLMGGRRGDGRGGERSSEEKDIVPGRFLPAHRMVWKK